MKEEQEYIVYKGDKVIGVGTQEELAKMLNIKKSSIYTLCTPSHLKLAAQRQNRTRAYLLEQRKEQKTCPKKSDATTARKRYRRNMSCGQ